MLSSGLPRQSFLERGGRCGAGPVRADQTDRPVRIDLANAVGSGISSHTAADDEIGVPVVNHHSCPPLFHGDPSSVAPGERGDLRLNWSSSIRSSSKRTSPRSPMVSSAPTRWRPGDATNCSVDGSVYQPSKKVKINIDNMYNRTARRYGEPWMGQEWQRSQAAETNGLSPVNVSMWPHRCWSGRLRVQCAGVDVARARTTARKRVLPGWSGRRPERRSQLELLLPEQD